ncbi:MAG: hypothetical protein LM580_07050 [Thermofilum sp.]|nr:hypothetical protein [Thermofilum sp.]MCC6050446.1 hypothetical protein [Thermofilum sp.]
MRHLEAAAIGLVFAIASAYMVALTARQGAGASGVGAQRALAWALLNAQSPENVTRLVSIALNGTSYEVHVLNPGEPLEPGHSVCYGAVLVNLTSGVEKIIVVCAGP